MSYNINYEVAGVAFMIIVAIFVRLRYTTAQKNSVIFRRFFLLLICAELLDVITAVMISKADVVPPTVNLISNTLYMCSAALTESTLVLYICAFSSDEKPVRIHRDVSIGVAAFYLSLMVINLFTNVVFSFTGGKYIHGPLYLVTFLIPLFYICEATFIMVFHRKLFKRNLIISVMIFNVLTLTGILTQLYLWPNTLTSYFGASLSVLIMVFTLETPDYLKLQDAMQKLRNSNVELEHLRNNLQDEVFIRTEELRERQHHLEQMTLGTVRSLAFAIDAKDEYTNGHSTRVSRYAVLLAEELGWDKESIRDLELAAVLHDIGKIGVPDRILNKPDRLAEIEYELVRSHTLIGSSILENLPDIISAREVARSHHERYDGKGYPDGLSGKNIPVTARLVGIADAFDAMNSKRVYRKELNRESIREELLSGRGKQFDPEMIDVFIRMFDEGKLDPEITGNEKDIFNGMRMTVDTEPREIDVLTALPTRIPAERNIRAEMEKANGCLAIIDIDRLRIVNDQFGHHSGDAVISAFAELLKKREEAISCRIGGDEFIFFISGDDQEKIEGIMDQLTEEFYTLKGTQFYMQGISLTIGAAFSRKGDRYEEIYSRADKALYHIKQSGHPGCYIYQENAFGKRPSVHTELETLVQGLEKNGDYNGVLQLDYREFARVYKLISKMAERYECKYELVMITLNSPTGENLYVENMDKAMECMQTAIMQVIRRVDVCTRYSTVQFLVMLMHVEREDAQRVVNRIFRGFYRIYGSDKIQPDYAMASVKPRIDKNENVNKKDREE